MGLLVLRLRRPVPAAIAALLTWALLGAAVARLAPMTLPPDHVTRIVSQRGLDTAGPLRWRGQLTSDPMTLPWGIRYELNLAEVESACNWLPVSGGMRVDYYLDQR